MAEDLKTSNSSDTTFELVGWTEEVILRLANDSPVAWNVIDDAMKESDFAEKLVQELESNQIFDVLTPARTTAEVQLDQVLAALSISEFNNSEYNSFDRSRFRGDKSVFLSREQRNRPAFAENHPCLSYLVLSIERCAASAAAQLQVAWDFSLTSVQLSEYPGDGISGYVRHCDRNGNLCAAESKRIFSNAERVLTCVYYLTPNDWDAELDGGSLRLFASDELYRDVIPYANRMVIFRSDCVEHQVLPSKRRPRHALTVWLYGILRKDAPSDTDSGFAREQHLPKSARTVAVPLPVPDLVTPHQTIFVSLAAYRDPETGPTLRNMMETARFSERVFCGLVLQVDVNDEFDQKNVLGSLPVAEMWYKDRVRTISMEARHATGPCPARAMCQLLHRGEDYILQIDSHMRFRPNWDCYLIEHLRKCPNPSKSVLTAYPVGYELPNQIPDETRGTLLVPWKFDEDGILHQKGRLFERVPPSPVKCGLYAAGFNFAASSILVDCPYDGSLHHLFFGEEILMALRLFKKGYVTYAPCQTVCYHLWSRTHRPPFIASEADKGKAKFHQKAVMIVRQQCEDRLCSVRSAQEFGSEFGIDFQAGTVLFDDSPFLVRNRHYSPDSVEGMIQSLDTNAKSVIQSFCL